MTPKVCLHEAIWVGRTTFYVLRYAVHSCAIEAAISRLMVREAVTGQEARVEFVGSLPIPVSLVVYGGEDENVEHEEGAPDGDRHAQGC